MRACPLIKLTSPGVLNGIALDALPGAAANKGRAAATENPVPARFKPRLRVT